MTSLTSKFEKLQTELAEHGLAARLDGLLLEALTTFLPGLALLYPVVGAWELLFHWDRPISTLALAAMALLSAGGHVWLLRELRLRRIPTEKAHPVAAAVAGIALLNAFSHLCAAGQVGSKAIVIIVVMTVACTFLSLRWLAWVVGGSVAGWLFAALLVPISSADFAAIVVMVVVAFSVHTLRLRNYRKLNSEHVAEREKMRADHLAELRRLDGETERAAGVLAAHQEMDALWEWDLKTDKLYFSPRWRAMLGYDDQALDPTPEGWFNLIHAHDLSDLLERLRAHLEGRTHHFESEHRIQQADGRYRWVLTRGLTIRNQEGGVGRMVGTMVDIKRMKNYEERLVHDATHDRLTSLPNREHLFERLQEEIAHKKRSDGYMFAVVFLDLDRFKDINDSLGHIVGDQLLAAVARRLKECVREWDLVARLGGDEFVVLMRRLQHEQQAIEVASRIQKALASTFQLDRNEIVTAASIGIALSSSAFESPEDLLRNADIAMYEAKARGKGHLQVFDSDMHVQATRVWNLQNELRRAVEQNQLELHYQPLVTLKTARISGAEALVRWRRSSGELVSPKEFIPIAEELGLIQDIGKWVLEEACRQNKAWQDAGLEPLKISVNLSARQLSSRDLIQTVRQVLLATELDPRWLQLEITESVLMGTTDATPANLDGLWRLGIHTAIDDFGTGYSSLSYLRKLHCHTLKIDRSFVADISSDEKAAALARSMITMAHGLQLSVVAEGVETQKQLAFLKRYRCDQMQGYLVSRPISAEHFTGLLKQDGTFLNDSEDEPRILVPSPVLQRG